MGTWSKDGSDGSEGSEGKEGGKDNLFLPPIYELTDQPEPCSKVAPNALAEINGHTKLNQPLQVFSF